MPKSKRAFESKQLRTRYRTWQIIATLHTVTIIKGKQSFEFSRLADFDAALRKGKAEVNKLEGPQEWNEGYTNEALR